MQYEKVFTWLILIAGESKQHGANMVRASLATSKHGGEA
jgi:hypothetical protein